MPVVIIGDKTQLIGLKGTYHQPRFPNPSILFIIRDSKIFLLRSTDILHMPEK